MVTFRKRIAKGISPTDGKNDDQEISSATLTRADCINALTNLDKVIF